MIRLRFFLTFLFVAILNVASGATIDDARAMINQGNYEEGRALLKKAAAESKKTSQSAEYLFLLGFCEIKQQQTEEGLKHLEEAKAKGSDKAAMELGKLAFSKYDFDSAEDNLSQYHKIREKAKKNVEEEYEVLMQKLEIAQNAIDRVEKIVIIDSLSVPRDTFYQFYKLSKSAGQLKDGSNISGKKIIPQDELCFISENEDFALWSVTNKEGLREIKEGKKLLNGEWIVSSGLQGEIDKEGNYDFGFMSADGQTLYFANDGEGSMGGYDIFVAQRDPLSGEYRQPLNMGMPFNSPYDDIMLAIDEEKGVGWWATDRNSPDGNITIYVYLLNDIRNNYPADTENLEDYAMITSYRMTQNPSDRLEYQRKLNSLPEMNEVDSETPDFIIKINANKVYTKYSDFKNRKASESMKQYLAAEKEAEKKQEELNLLRGKFALKDKTVTKEKLQELENERDKAFAKAKALKNEVYRLERSTK